jgi:hypothetical protein
MVNRTILLRNVNAPARTDADFLTYHVNDYSIDEHLKDPNDVSPFLNVNLPMVSGFVIDPMHTVIEGAFGRRLEGFVFVPAEGKLTSKQIAEANKRIKFFHLSDTDLTVLLTSWKNARTIRFMYVCMYIKISIPHFLIY